MYKIWTSTRAKPRVTVNVYIFVAVTVPIQVVFQLPSNVPTHVHVTRVYTQRSYSIYAFLTYSSADEIIY